MTKRNSTCAGLIAAVGYLRRSTSRQEKSLEDQQQEIERYAAKHGYRIVRWYIDDAISGDATECRQAFQDMHAAGCKGRDFSSILVWHTDRFGRFTPHEASYWTFPLAKAGVRLVSVCQGVIDWNDFTEWLKYSVDQHGAHQFLRGLSRNVARSLIRNAALGRSCGQRPPYGYDRVLIDEQGAVQQRIRRGQQYSKPRSWRVIWAPADDPLEISTVLWLFNTYATTDIGYRAMADQLNERGVPGPTGGKWYDSTIKALLGNEAYVGTFTWNKRRHGKYHRIVKGEIIERDPAEVRLMPCGKPNANHNPRELWTIVENAHEPLIDRQLFDAVQAKIERRKRSSGCSYQTHTKRTDRDQYLLTGLLFCAHCGRTMHGTTCTRKKNGKTYRYQKYICSGYTRGDRSCGHHAIRQAVIVNAILQKLRQDLLHGGVKQLETVLERKLQERSKPNTSQIARLQQRLRQLDQQVEQGAERLLTVPAELLDTVTTKLQQIKRERDQVAAELQQAELAAKPLDVTKSARQLARKAWTLADELQKAEPARLRELLQRAVERVELSYTVKQRGKKREYHPTSGKVVFRELSGFASRGDRI